jgi:hypothetical protein
MSAVAYHAPSCKTDAPTHKSAFARLLDALYESRMRKAQEEIARHSHLFRQFEEARLPEIPRTEDQLPFGR